jgi:uncharacterized protein
MDRRGGPLGNHLHLENLKAGRKTLQGKIPRWILRCTLYAVCAFSPVGVEQTVAVRQVAAAGRQPHAASLQSFQIPSHGALLNAFVYVAAGEGPHPAVILLHGFPGNERNLDLAQEIRRAGWDVLYFDYRGSWGSPGSFSFSHGIEDTAAAVDFLRTPAMAATLNLDPERIVVIGHSMGGFMAVQAAATDPRILGVALISASDIGGHVVPLPLPKEREQAVVQGLSNLYDSWGMAPLAGCTPEGLAYETIDNASQWSFMARVSALESRPALVITSDDGNISAGILFASELRRAGNTRVSTLHLPTDHAYSDQRGPLAGAVLRWLASITPAGAR